MVWVLGSPIASWLAEKIGSRKVQVAGIFVLSIGIFLTLSASVWVIIFGMCLSCLGFFTAHSLAAASVSREATHHKGGASSLYLISYYVGVGAGSTLLGPLWDAVGWNGLTLFTAILPLVYIGLVSLIERYFKKSNPKAVHFN